MTSTLIPKQIRAKRRKKKEEKKRAKEGRREGQKKGGRGGEQRKNTTTEFCRIFEGQKYSMLISEHFLPLYLHVCVYVCKRERECRHVHKRRW